MEERRKIERTAVDEIAYVTGDGASIRCRVVNVSSHGCAIEIRDTTLVRATFKLVFERDRTFRDCRLIWISGNRVGVEFVHEQPNSSSDVQPMGD